METGIGEFIRVKFPTNVPNELRYNFNWQMLENEDAPFQNIDYSAVS